MKGTRTVDVSVGGPKALHCYWTWSKSSEFSNPGVRTGESIMSGRRIWMMPGPRAIYYIGCLSPIKYRTTLGFQQILTHGVGCEGPPAMCPSAAEEWKPPMGFIELWATPPSAIKALYNVLSYSPHSILNPSNYLLGPVFEISVWMRTSFLYILWGWPEAKPVESTKCPKYWRRFFVLNQNPVNRHW